MYGSQGCYEIEVWWSWSGLGSYYSKLDMSAFICMKTGPAGPVLAESLLSKFYSAKAGSK